MLSTRLLAFALVLPISVTAVAQFQGVKGSPYVMTQTTTHVQKLSDGTTLTHVTTRKEARDSEGRTARITTQEQPSGPGQNFTNAVINDPVARTTTIWNSRNKQAIVTHRPEPRMLTIPSQPTNATGAVNGVANIGVVTAAGAGSGAAVSTDMIHANNSESGQHLRPAIQSEPLGSKAIAGVYAQGNRVTTTYPAGLLGNDQPLVETRETWTSPDLKLMLEESINNPRNGQTRIETTSFDRSEPDPKLFQAPEGYTIKEHDLHNANQ
jgi:hypothetical protein